MRENGPGRFRAVFLAFLHLSCRRSHALEQLGMGTLVASSAKSPPPFHQNRRCPGWYMTLDGPPPEEALAPALLGMPRGQKRLNGRFWGHCVGEAVGAPRTAGVRASSGGGPPRVIYHPGQRRFWCNGGSLFALEARDQHCSVQKRLKRVPAGRLGRARSRAFVGRFGTRAAYHASQTC